jgi:hypothetical protein
VALFRSTRERRLWLAVAVAVAALLVSLYPLQFALDALRARNLLRLTIGGLFLLCAAAGAVALVRRRAPLAAWLVGAAAGAVYAGCALAMEVPQERLHLVEYGVWPPAARRRREPPRRAGGGRAGSPTPGHWVATRSAGSTRPCRESSPTGCTICETSASTPSPLRWRSSLPQRCAR